MAVKVFPKALYKGDSISIVFSLKDRETKEKHEFEEGDKLQIGIKATLEDTDYQAYKEFTITEPGTDINIYFTPEETDKLTELEQKGILEVRYIYNNGASRATVYQEKISLEGVVIDE
jgi:hypothetical protein